MVLTNPDSKCCCNDLCPVILGVSSLYRCARVFSKDVVQRRWVIGWLYLCISLPSKIVLILMWKNKFDGRSEPDLTWIFGHLYVPVSLNKYTAVLVTQTDCIDYRQHYHFYPPNPCNDHKLHSSHLFICFYTLNSGNNAAIFKICFFHGQSPKEPATANS